ncbi:ABC transporter ATP-binding protein [Eisenbergiella massiliensis]|uniref:ABC transporter ATP-binding protein n=1 Tax=Eisenbergiella massiliensis TaxID=1720294 RepID=A0A3E3I4N5_9FIRM|nr:ABC transporter ATP-binding protein [Eisenbergiella massiliensis]RGE60257.1 ABC transporter ATP-binding protein [Eisenbergiella massiliensis]
MEDYKNKFSDDNVLLSIKNLTVEYRTEDGIVQAVNGVSLQVHKGETLGLVGETGAGKTTIAKAIMRILPNPPAKVVGGEIFFDRKDINLLSIEEMRKIRGNKISMIFQDPMTALNPTLTIGQQIADVIQLHNNISRNEVNERVVKMLEMVGILRDRFKDYPHQFSGGMKQRVIIAMALACKPELLLSDEATTALDVTIQAQVLAMMKNLRNELGTSMIMITHDLGIVAETCDSVAVIYSGQIVEYGTVFDVFDKPAHPYTIGLFGTLPNINKKIKRLRPIPGMMPDPAELPKGCKFWERCPYAAEACKVKQINQVEVDSGHFVLCLRTAEVRK